MHAIDADVANHLGIVKRVVVVEQGAKKQCNSATVMHAVMQNKAFCLSQAYMYIYIYGFMFVSGILYVYKENIRNRINVYEHLNTYINIYICIYIYMHIP